MTNIPFERFAFLDFEASSLDRDSWPIEIGLSWVTPDLQVQTFDSLIKPSPEWPERAWSYVSAGVHNIPRKNLDVAPDLRVVTREFLGVLGDRIALSDAPGFERHWLNRLLNAAHVKTHVEIQDFDATTFQIFPSAALDQIYEQITRKRTKHRAGSDSAGMAQAWAAGLKLNALNEVEDDK